MSVLSFCGFKNNSIKVIEYSDISLVHVVMYSTCSIHLSGWSLSAELFSITMRVAVKICEPMHLPDTAPPVAHNLV